MNNDVIIIGGGISGLSALHFLRTLKPELSVHLYEADNRLGGTIGTDVIDGYSFDWGPNGFLDREPLTLRLCEELGLQGNIERANENVSNRFILRDSKLRAVPMSPPAFLKSDILPLSGKLRILFEPFGKKAPDGVDESVYDFVKRRIGVQAADYLVQPMVSGIYGGLADKLSLKSCFPIMNEMETEYGSLFKAMIAKAKEAKKKGKKSGGPSGPGGWLTSFKGGLNKIIESFESEYKDNISVSSEVLEIKKENNQFLVKLSNGDSHNSKYLIIGSPSYTAGRIAKSLSAGLAKSLSEIKYAPISVVCLGYDETNIKRNLNGFGFLVPQRENKRILGAIWTSSIFSDRAPQGKVQFRCMVGGDGDHDSYNLNDEELLNTVTNDLDEILGINGDPETVKIYRWKNGIPQFHIGHSVKMDTIEKQLHQIGNIYVTGNAYYGIGLNDCVKQSYKVVNQIINE